MEKAQYSKGTFFEKELLKPFQVSESFLHPLPPKETRKLL